MALNMASSKIQLYVDEELSHIELTQEVQNRWYDEWSNLSRVQQWGTEDNVRNSYYVPHYSWKSMTVKGRTPRECFLRYCQVREYEWEKRGVKK